MRHKRRMSGFDEARMHRVIQAVIECDGSRAKAARELGLSLMQVNRQITNATMRGICVPDAKGPGCYERAETGYMPSADEILWTCLEIRSEWNEETRRQRYMYQQAPWEAPAPGSDYSAFVEAVA